MPHSLLRNMSTMPRETAAIRPAQLCRGAILFALPLRLARNPAALAQGADLSKLIEEETLRLGLRGCALVRDPWKDEAAEAAPPLLALVVLSKSSGRIFLPTKTPLLDRETLSRRLVSCDPRLRSAP